MFVFSPAASKSRVLLATEIGEGFGHLLPWRKTLLDMSAAGHGVAIACDRPAEVAKLFGSNALGFLNIQMLEVAGSPQSSDVETWPELLLSLGYGDGLKMTAHLRAWVTLLQVHRINLVIADHAPTAMLAAKLIGLHLIEASGGFCVPPAIIPMAGFSGEFSAQPETALSGEEKLLASWNQALEGVGSAIRLESVKQLFEGHQRYVLSVAALDPYGPRSDVTYTGALPVDLTPTPNTQADLWWSEVGGEVLVYLKLKTPGLKDILRTLERSDRRVLAVVPGIGADRLMGKKMYLTGSPVDLPTLLPSAELLLTNGGNHVVGLAIAAGIPLVCIPMQPEQALTALRVATGGFGEYWLSDLHEVGRLANFMQPPRSVGN